jgi:hypothetical protein
VTIIALSAANTHWTRRRIEDDLSKHESAVVGGKASDAVKNKFRKEYFEGIYIYLSFYLITNLSNNLR